MKNIFWVNNGIEEKQIRKDSEIPEGFVKGRLSKIPKWQIIAETIDREDLRSYYRNHLKSDTADHFKVSEQQLYYILKFYGIKKDMKGISTRTHDSYLEGGKKSSKTQKESWCNKSDREKLEWSEKQKIAHSTQDFKEKISKINKDYLRNLDENVKNERYHRVSQSCKSWWYNNFTEEERKEQIKISLENGAGWNHKKIKGSESKPNLLFKEKLLEYGLYESDEENREFTLDNFSYDFRINNQLIEINPTATHNSTWGIFNKEGLNKTYHSEKSNVAKNHNYRCIHIWDWDDPDKIIKQFLLPKERIYARTCEIREISKDEASKFINENHLQGYANDSIRIGLYSNNQLVSIMTFGNPRYNNNFEYELIRYCSSKNIVGGAERLFSFFTKKYNPKSIISYCDLSKFTGDTYIKLGFTLQRVSISKHWFNMKTGIHITDNLLRARGYDQLFGANYGKGFNNEDLMKQAGFVEIYDAGQATYVCEVQ